METFGPHLLSRLRGRPDVRLLRCVLLAAVWIVAACAPTMVPPGPPAVAPALAQDAFVAPDGMRLPLHAWPANPKLRAVVVALHGFNDYGNFINDAAEYWSKHGITTYAYDQRGFGDAPHRGLWPGVDAFTQDLAAAVSAIQARHPSVPVFALGESMGGAVVMATMTGPSPPDVAGVILAAPAVWARSTMPFYQRWALWIGVHTFPATKLTGRGLNILPSDNIPMLRAMSRDPKVIKATRIDAIWGLANLMDAALEAAPEFRTPALILYGAKDEIITEKPMKAMLNRLPEDAADRHVIIRYEQGYHMILRDLQAERVWRDIEQWIEARIAQHAARDQHRIDIQRPRSDVSLTHD